MHTFEQKPIIDLFSYMTRFNYFYLFTYNVVYIYSHIVAL